MWYPKERLLKKRRLRKRMDLPDALKAPKDWASVEDDFRVDRVLSGRCRSCFEGGP